MCPRYNNKVYVTDKDLLQLSHLDHSLFTIIRFYIIAFGLWNHRIIMMKMYKILLRSLMFLKVSSDLMWLGDFSQWVYRSDWEASRGPCQPPCPPYPQVPASPALPPAPPQLCTASGCALAAAKLPAWHCGSSAKQLKFQLEGNTGEVFHLLCLYVGTVHKTPLSLFFR